jgi:hypothetical protein
MGSFDCANFSMKIFLDDERGTGYDVVLWIEEAVAAAGV